MGNVSLINGPWCDTLLRLVEETEHSVTLVAPFVKAKAVSQVLEVKSPGVKVTAVSNFRVGCFWRGGSDTEAFDLILQSHGRVLNCQRLHAKIYVFDDTRAVVTSANLTPAGLSRSLEYGVLVSDPRLVSEIRTDVDALMGLPDTGTVTRESLRQIEAILAALPPEQMPTFPKLAQAEMGVVPPAVEDALPAGSEHHIEASLEGWLRETFRVLLRIPAHEFGLGDVYGFVPELQRLYPGNHNIEAKLRQQLQFLRDLGLLEFLGGGRYCKLWC